MNIATQAIGPTVKVTLRNRPLWRPEIVQECLGISRQKMMEMIESGQLAWAWNIGSGCTHKEVRVLGLCVLEKQTSAAAGIGNTRSLRLPQVLELLLPQLRSTLRGAELQRLFACDADTVRKLHQGGELERVRENLPKQGVNASPRFTVASVAKFLERKRIT